MRGKGRTQGCVLGYDTLNENGSGRHQACTGTEPFCTALGRGVGRPVDSRTYLRLGHLTYWVCWVLGYLYLTDTTVMQSFFFFQKEGGES